MMKVTAVFEHWHLGDRNYYAFAVGDDVRVSFELDVEEAEFAPPDASCSVEIVRDAEYAVTARVIRRYADGIDSPFPVLEAGRSTVAALAALMSRYFPSGVCPDMI